MKRLLSVVYLCSLFVNSACVAGSDLDSVSAAYPMHLEQPAAAEHDSFPGMRDVPDHLALTWGQEPIVEKTPTSGEIVLNGLWKFQPGYVQAEPPVDTAWTWMQVPGSWGVVWNMPHLTVRGEGELWSKFGDGREVGIGWYERPIWVPSSWEGRRITIDFDRISTDSEVYVNGVKCGATNWPGGIVDITEAVKFGAENKLRVKVLAIGDEREVVALMGTEAGHNSAPKKAKLTQRGIISDVVLKSQAPGPELRAIGIRTSVRENRMTVSFRADAGAAPANWSYKLKAAELDGTVAKSWKVKTAPTQGAYGRWVFSVSWDDPELWDVDNPHLYNLYLSVSDGAKTTVYAERFGFREFWVEGRDFYLNGSIFRLRPMSHGFSNSYYPGIPEIMDGEITGYLEAGFNIKQIWPVDFRQRGRVDYSTHYATKTDERGLGLMAPVASFAHLVDDWGRDGVQERWRRDMIDDIERMQNHPSILIWTTSANRFGHGDDQNPMRIGQKTRGPVDDAAWSSAFKVAEDGTDQINRFDASRPVLVHQGSATGNIYGTNTYLNLHPLQEREEWLSEWATTGDMPYIAVEFGSPMDGTFMRGRFGGHWAGISEYLMTEHAADYLGPRAYTLEDADYRTEVKQRNDNPPTDPNWHANRTVNDEAAFQEVTSLFVEKNWRSWRTWGVSGGMIAWSLAGGIENDWSGGYHANYQQVPKPDFVPGTRGVHFFKDHLPAAAVHYIQPEGNTFRPTFKALKKNSQPTIAYIGGKPGEWVEKGHHFYPEEIVQKQAVLINDSRQNQAYSLEWVFSLNGAALQSGKAEGTLQIGEIGFEPMEALLPAVSTKESGTITLTGAIGDVPFEDSFEFTVYPAPAAVAVEGRVILFDPHGRTDSYLDELGIQSEAFDGNWSGLSLEDTLVIGELAMKGQTGLPAELFDFVERGGSVLMLAQPREWFEENTSLRYSRHASRHYWPVEGSADHPVVAGLDAGDLRDWRGSGASIPERGNVDLIKDSYRATPIYGWHWGNRGSVASVALEKPHNSGWTPLLQGDFALNYSPLMELVHGKGRFIVSGLDLVARGEVNPVGDIITKRLISYLSSAAEAPSKKSVHHSGSEAQQRFLKQAGFSVASADSRPTDGQLWVVDSGTSPSFDALKAYAESGGNVLAIEASNASLPTGVQTQASPFGMHPSVPDWNVLDGVSVADLHIRFDQQVELLTGESKGFHIGAGGMLGYYPTSQGSIVYLQLHPSKLDEEYLRLSNWAYTRLMTQLMANLGAANQNDVGALVYRENPYAPISLVQNWRVHAERILETAADINAPNIDTGNEGVKLGWHQPDFDDGDWIEAEMPMAIEFVDPKFEKKDGAFWFRTEVDIPEEWAGREFKLNLRRLDDFDITYFNGNRIGATNKMTPNAWNVIREYVVPAWASKPGRNVISIRVFDHFGGGGMMVSDLSTFKISLVEEPEELGPYVPGFRHDRKNGDDPFRYYRW